MAAGYLHCVCGVLFALMLAQSVRSGRLDEYQGRNDMDLSELWDMPNAEDSLGVVLLEDEERSDFTTDAIQQSSMSDEQQAELRVTEEAAQARQTKIATELAFEKAILQHNETDTADWFQDELDAVKANYTARLAQERFRVLKVYIDQAAEYIASKFQEAAVVKEVGKTIDKDLQYADTLKLENLQQIAEFSAEQANFSTQETMTDFVRDALEEVHYRKDQQPLQFSNESGILVSNGTDTTSLVDPEEPDLNPPPVERELGESQQPTSVRQQRIEGEKEAVPRLDDVAGSVYPWWPTAQVPGVEPDEDGVEPALGSNISAPTLDAYNQIIDIGLNSSQGVRATRMLQQREAKRLYVLSMKEREEGWSDMIDSKARIEAFSKITERENRSLTVIAEHLRQDLNLNDNETQAKVKEHLIENRVDASTPEGQRVVYEYTTMCSKMTLTDEVIEKAREELGRQTEHKVLPRYMEAYKPVIEETEKQRLKDLANTTAHSTVEQRLHDLAAMKQAVATAKEEADSALLSSMSNADTTRQRQILAVEAKLNQALNLVKQHGAPDLATRLESAMQAASTNRAAVVAGSVDAITTAAAAQKEVDDTLALAAGSIPGDPGTQLLSLKIQIDTMKTPDPQDDLEAAANDVMNNPLGYDDPENQPAVN